MRELPIPLFTTEYRDDFFAILDLKTENERVEVIKQTLSKIPKAHYVFASDLFMFLADLAKNASETKMHASNLGLVIGPNLFKMSNASVDLSSVMKPNQLAQIIIENVSKIF